MSDTSPSPSPIARFLLSLAERGATGRVEVGGRSVRLDKGRVVDVSPAEGDGDLMAFLRDSGRVARGPLDRCAEKAREENLPLSDILRRQRLLSDEAIADVTRGLWLDRLVRGMARASAEGREPSPLLADTSPHPDQPSTSLVSLVLDALERRAADEDAGRVGARAGHHLEWLPGPHEAKARRWARFTRVTADRPSIAKLLQTEPAAAPRIAALVRASLARIVAPGSLPPPPPRPSSIPATSMAARTPPPEPTAQRINTPTSTRRPVLHLDPGLSPVFEDAPELDVALTPIPKAVAVLEDPLDILERTIGSLEQSSSPGAARAKAWLEFGEAWETRFGSVEEAARAYREAAAADNEHAEALERASDRCASIGQADLAVAYARARVQLEPEGKPRARALLSYALLCRRLGKVSEALGAARSAASGDESDPAAPALAAHLWYELGRPQDAASAAAEAAKRARADDPARALSLIALARGLDPTPARSEDYADELANSGLIEAAIAVRADAVRRTRDKDQRRMLVMEAAEMAEAANRPVLAAALLTRAFDAEPHLDVLYEPLDADLSQAGALLERAIVLEEIAAAAPEESRAHWLGRAAEAREQLPGDGTWQAELRVRALELNPGDEASLKALREQAVVLDDDRLLADALERALLRGRWEGAGLQASMLEELAAIAEDALHAPLRALWAWKRLRAIDPNAAGPDRQIERLTAVAAEHERTVEGLEAELKQKKTKDEDRLSVARRLADLLRDEPDRRRRAVSLYREVLDAQPDDIEVADSLERVQRLIGDDYHEGQTIAIRAEHSANRVERIRALTRLASLHVLRRDLREAAIACRKILAEVPGHREASIRLRRVASRLHDRELLREALAAEVHTSLPNKERARTLTALALELEVAHGVEEAISCAEAALTADPRSAEAALLVVRHIGSVGEPRAALGVVRALFGDAPPILEAWARVARDAGERDVMLEALDAWARIDPNDPEPSAMRLLAFPAAASDDAIAAAIDEALDGARLTPELARPIATAVERLGERDPERAAALAVRASDAFGSNGDALRELATRLASATTSTPLRIAALERKAASQLDEARVETLHELAALHEENNDRAAEARTHLRVLAVAPHERRSLRRLETLYAETGETERLMAVLALELEGADDEDRIEPLLKLAACAVEHGNQNRAEAFLRDAWNPAIESTEPLFTAAAALVRLDRARAAVELLREAGRETEPARAGPIFVRAVQTALRKVDDSRLALMTAVEGLDHATGSGPLLVAFEQLALELKDVAAADRVYGRLIDRAMGPHGKRALSYRKARWLERAGASRAALDAYLEAFLLAPRGGALYTSIGRLARAHGDLEALAKATTALGEQATHPAIRAAMRREGARLLEEEIGSPERAFDVLVALWEETTDDELEPELGRLAKLLEERDEKIGEAAFQRLRDGLDKGVENAWMVEAKARLRMRYARLLALFRDDVTGATAAIDAGLSLLDEEEGDPDVSAELNVELAHWLIAAGRTDEASARVRQALAVKPNHPAALALGVQLDVDREVPTPRARSRPASFPAAAEPGSVPPRLPSPPRLPTPAYGTTQQGAPPAVPGPPRSPVEVARPTAPQPQATEETSAAEAEPRPTEPDEDADGETTTDELAAHYLGADTSDEERPSQQPLRKSSRFQEFKERRHSNRPSRRRRPTDDFELVGKDKPSPKKGAARDPRLAAPRVPGFGEGKPVESTRPSRKTDEFEALRSEPPLAPTPTLRRPRHAPSKPTFELLLDEPLHDLDEPISAPLPAGEPIEVSLGSGSFTLGVAPAEEVGPDEVGPDEVGPEEVGPEEATASAPVVTAEATASAPVVTAEATASAPVVTADAVTADAVTAEAVTAEAVTADAVIPSDTAPDGVPRPTIGGWRSVSPPSSSPSEPPPHLSWVSKPQRDDDAAAMEERAQRADVDQAIILLKKALSLEPWRLSAARALAQLSGMRPDHRATILARSLLSMIEPSDEEIPLLPTVPRTRLDDLLREPAYEANRRLWSTLWRHALPLFRDRTAPDVSPNDLVTRVATTPLARAYTAALDGLRIDQLPPFYHRRRGVGAVQVIRAAKPLLLASGDFAESESAMTFELGRALELSRPENILLATLPEPRALEVIGAVIAAFGPADHGREVDRTSAALAADLWRTISTSGQAEIRDLLESTERWEDYGGSRTAVLDAGDRAGLIVCRDLKVALEVLLDEPPASEDALVEQLKKRPASALVHFAFEKLARD